MVTQVKVSQHDMSSGTVPSGGPGIVVLSSSMQVRHMNHHAQRLITGLIPTTSEAQQSNDQTPVLPPALVNLAGEVLRVLRSRHERNERGLIEIRHSVIEIGKPVFSTALGLSNELGVEYARIVLLLTGTRTPPLGRSTEFLKWALTA